MFVSIRILIVSSRLQIAINMRKALQQVHDFEVDMATEAESAIEQMTQRPRDIVILDYGIPNMPLSDLILRLRSLQPELAVLVGPDSSEAQALVRDLNLQGAIDIPVPARTLIPLIREAVEQVRDQLPDTSQSPPVDIDDVTPSMDASEPGLNIHTPEQEPPLTPVEPDDVEGDTQKSETIEFVLSDSGGPAKQVQENVRRQQEMERDTDQALELFKRLAEEEPPAPELEESGTVGDLRRGLKYDTDIQNVIDILAKPATETADDSSEPVKPTRLPEENKDTADFLLEDDEDTGSNPALLILSAAQDDNTPTDAFSVDELLLNIQKQLPPSQQTIQPLPSWVKESEPYIQEPSFLPDELPPPDDAELLELNDTSIYAGQTTHPSSSQARQIEPDPESLDTDRIEPESQSRPVHPGEIEMPPSLPEAPVQETERPAESVDVPDLEPVDEAVPDETEIEPIAPDIGEPEPLPETEPDQPESEMVSPLESAEVSLVPDDVEAADVEFAADPEIARRALVLTQASLELTAEACLLARDGEVVAYTGKLPFEEVEAVRNGVSDDWEAADGKSRIRFLNLPSSGTDYMLYSRRTKDGFTLSMIFTGTMPLRVIRLQARRLVEALESVPEQPEVQVEEDVEAAVDAAIELLESGAVDHKAEPEPAPEPVAESDVEPIVSEPPQETGPLVPYTFVWLLNDPNQTLSTLARRAIQDGLTEDLSQEQWQIEQLDVREDHVYLYAASPGEKLPHTHVHYLMSRSAELAAEAGVDLTTGALWADGYQILVPGREMDTEEIQTFISFSRE